MNLETLSAIELGPWEHNPMVQSSYDEFNKIPYKSQTDTKRFNSLELGLKSWLKS